MSITYLGLGTNLGNKELNLNAAMQLIEKQVGRIVAVSEVMQTDPVGFASEQQFLNAVLKVETWLSPTALLIHTQQIERQMGRTQKSADGVYSDRIIDIDILLYDQLVIDTPELKIPHPLITERDFVYMLLANIDTCLKHPVSGIKFSDIK